MSAESEARRIMFRNKFDYNKTKASLIWAAKWRVCSKCGASRGKACEDLNKRAQGKLAYTVNPHKERIDWEMLAEKLKARGYR